MCITSLQVTRSLSNSTLLWPFCPIPVFSDRSAQCESAKVGSSKCQIKWTIFAGTYRMKNMFFCENKRGCLSVMSLSCTWSTLINLYSSLFISTDSGEMGHGVSLCLSKKISGMANNTGFPVCLPLLELVYQLVCHWSSWCWTLGPVGNGGMIQSIFIILPTTPREPYV